MVGRRIKKERLRLFRPTLDHWEYWEGEPWVLYNTGFLKELPIVPNATLALPARWVIAVPLWLPKTDIATAKKMVEVELEVKGILSRAANLVSIRIITTTENQMLICAQIFPHPFPERFSSSAFGYFVASPLFADLEKDTLHLWREEQNIVVTFTNGKEPIYWETLPASAPHSEILTWLECMRLPLMEQGFLSSKIRFLNFMHLDLPLPIPNFCVESPSPEASQPGLCSKPPLCDWQPLSRRLTKKVEARKKAYVRMGAVLGSCYLLLTASFAVWVGFCHLEASRMRKRVNALEPEIRALLAAQKQWNLLSPTIDASSFPVEILRHVVDQMPAKGIWLTQFEFDNGKLGILGEVESVSVAAQFLASLSQTLPKNQLEMPPPSLLPNNRAQFVISGGTHETTH